MKHFTEHFKKLNKGQIRKETSNGGESNILRDTSGDDSTEASSEEQNDVSDFFVKGGECTPMDISVINVSDDDDNVSKTESIKNKSRNNLSTKNSAQGQNIVPRKRGRPPKIVNKNNATTSNSSGMPNIISTCDNIIPGRTKPDYKSIAQSLHLTTSRSLSCAIKFGEPVGMSKGHDRDNEHDPDVAILNRPKRFISQKQGTSSDVEENVDMSWQEMRDLEKALVASLRKRNNSPSDSNTANAQRKFVQSVNVPKKRGRKKKEVNNIPVNEKAYTEDFINFLCLRSSSRKRSLPTSNDLFMSCCQGDAKQRDISDSCKMTN